MHAFFAGKKFGADNYILVSATVGFLNIPSSSKWCHKFNALYKNRSIISLTHPSYYLFSTICILFSLFWIKICIHYTTIQHFPLAYTYIWFTVLYVSPLISNLVYYQPWTFCIFTPVNMTFRCPFARCCHSPHTPPYAWLLS